MHAWRCVNNCQCHLHIVIVGFTDHAGMVNNPFTQDKKENAPDAKDLQDNLKDNLEAEGANVEVFSENASPEEKARATLKAQDDVKPRGQFAEHM